MDLKGICENRYINLTKINYMTNNETSELIIKEVIIGIGVAEGMWINVGVNPFEEALNVFISLLYGTEFEWYGPITKILLLIVSISQIVLIAALGRTLGLLALLIAFVGGIYIDSLFGIALVFLALYIGLRAIS